MQRLFSTFADGWPGIGLLLIRVLTGAAMVHFGIDGLRGGGSLSASLVLPLICVASGIVLLAGLFTPVVGALAAMTKTWIAISGFQSHSDDPWLSVAQAILAAALAMIGPGAYSIDARRFGRKHIDFSER